MSGVSLSAEAAQGRKDPPQSASSAERPTDVDNIVISPRSGFLHNVCGYGLCALISYWNYLFAIY